jgi:hypothetical protein
VPIIQTELASVATTTSSGNLTVTSASITRESSPQTPSGSHHIPTSTINSSGVPSSNTISPSDTPIVQPSSATSTTKSLSVSTIFAIALGGAALVAAVLSFTFWVCRRSPPVPQSAKRARYLRKRRPLRLLSGSWTTIVPVVSPDNADELTATPHPPGGKSTPAATSPPSLRRPSGFRIPRKAPPRLPSWALSTSPEIPETRSPEPFRLIPEPVPVRVIPSTTINTHQPQPQTI